MTPRERIMTVLAGGMPDRVPYYETGIDAGLLRKLGLNPNDAAAVSRALQRDNVAYNGPIQPPWNCDVVRVEGGAYAYRGRIRTRADLSKLDFGPADLSAVTREAIAFNAHKGEFASCGVTALGLSSMIISMGYENFCYALADDPAFVEELLELFVDEAVRRIELANECGFDMYQVQEDIAFKTAPYVSPAWYAEVALPRLKRAAAAMAHPWIFHSDGNITPLLPHIIRLGAAGINPIEPQAMDLAEVKRGFGQRIVLCGNVSVEILETGTPADVRCEVERCMRAAKAGGRYLISSSNSLTANAKPENVLAMVEAIQELGRYG